MTVYIDLLFIINFINDFLVLNLADSFYKNNSKFYQKAILKKIIGAFFGAVYSVLFVLDIDEIYYSPFIKILFVFIICGLSFLPCDLKTYIIKTINFFIISTIYSGMLFLYINYISEYKLSYFNLLLNEYILFLGVISIFLILKFILYFFKEQLLSKNNIIKIYYNKKCVKLTGIYDSANFLKDPISLSPVILINEAVLKKLICKEVNKNNLSEFVRPNDFKIIPFKTVAENGILNAFTPDKCIINGKIIKNVVIAISPQKMSEDVIINSSYI